MGFDPPPYPYDRLAPLAEAAARHEGGIVDLSIGTPYDPPPAVVADALVALYRIELEHSATSMWRDALVADSPCVAPPQVGAPYYAYAAASVARTMVREFPDDRRRDGLVLDSTNPVVVVVDTRPTGELADELEGRQRCRVAGARAPAAAAGSL